jgi:hypothetical protein
VERFNISMFLEALSSFGTSLTPEHCNLLFCLILTVSGWGAYKLVTKKKNKLKLG